MEANATREVAVKEEGRAVLEVVVFFIDFVNAGVAVAGDIVEADIIPEL